MIRTDLALEACDGQAPTVKGIKKLQTRQGEVTVTRIWVQTSVAAAGLNKPKGAYVTVEWRKPAEEAHIHNAVTRALASLLPKRGTVLVVGLGNKDITPDALGPKTAARVLATRHISAPLAQEIGLQGLRSVAVLAPGVLGQTGIESMELLAAAVERLRPSGVLAVDALAARSLNRLCRTVQICNTGISPGSGVGNARAELSAATLGVPVVALGVPTVVDAATLVADLAGQTVPHSADMMVTPREIDAEITRTSSLLGHAINCALQPKIDPEVLRGCV